jgi:hypothetical protein
MNWPNAMTAKIRYLRPSLNAWGSTGGGAAGALFAAAGDGLGEGPEDGISAKSRIVAS